MAETKKSLVARLFAEHGSSVQAFLYRRLRGHFGRRCSAQAAL
jgi:hypothetical protein